MKRKRQTTAKAKQQANVDRWLLSCDELLEALIATAGVNLENRKALGSILVSKTYKLLREQEQPTLH